MFDEPTCAIFNLAVGGGWPGATEHSTPNPDTLAVHWMRRTPWPLESLPRDGTTTPPNV